MTKTIKYQALLNKIQAHLDRTSGVSAQVRSELTRAGYILSQSMVHNADVYAAYANGILFAIENPANR